MKLKNSNCDNIKKKTPVVMKLKYSNVDKNLKTQIVTKLKNAKGDKTQKLKLWRKKLNKN